MTDPFPGESVTAPEPLSVRPSISEPVTITYSTDTCHLLIRLAKSNTVILVISQVNFGVCTHLFLHGFHTADCKTLPCSINCCLCLHTVLVAIVTADSEEKRAVGGMAYHL